MEDEGEIKKMIDKALGKFFFLCNVPFIAVEKRHFLEFVDTLMLNARKRPRFSYKPPCRKTLATTILQQLYEEVQHEKKEILKNTNCVLQVDGWKNSETNKKLLVFSLTNFRLPLLYLTSVDISLDREDGETLSTLINDSIKFAEDEYDVKVESCISDNDSKIKAGVRLARTPDNKRLMQSSCGSHSGNRLFISMVNLPFKEKISKIINEFSTPKAEALIHRLGGTKLKMFPETRWCYLRDSCESILKNLNIMKRKIRLGDHGIQQSICDLVNSVDLKNEIKLFMMIIKPVCILINKCQDARVNIADAAQLWLQLASKIPVNTYDNIISERIKKAIWPVGYAANLLHHKYQGQLLNADQLIMAETFLHEKLDAQAWQELQSFLTNRESYEFLASRSKNPYYFWCSIDHIYKNLARFSKSIFIIPASTARLEGLFSQWTYIHNNYRNRLGDLKSSQLIDIYSYYTITQPQLLQKPKKTHLSIDLDDDEDDLMQVNDDLMNVDDDLINEDD